MKKKEVEEYLREKPGYLKVGPDKLALKLGITRSVAKECQQKIKKELRYPKVKDQAENLILKSKWQAQTKEGIVWMESYRNVDTDPEPLTKEDWIEVFKEVGGIIPLRIEPTIIEGKRTLIIWSSDKHIGASIPDDALYKLKYDEHIFHKRMLKILEYVINFVTLYGKFDKIIMADLGDSLDGYNKQTTRGGHDLPQNLNNKEAARVHFFTHKYFIDQLVIKELANEIIIWNVTNDNHSGDFGWMAFFGLQQYAELAWPDIQFVNQEEFLGHFTVYNKAFITTHGKDKKNRFKNLPLYLNDATESFLMDYILHHRLTDRKIHIRKGDLHMNVVDCSRPKMSYINVGSVFGSSDWIMDNFGYGEASCFFEIVEEHSDNINSSIAWL